ncbi:CRISPR system precrRNA processing endoribonuclease RAMP protein Cas6 [Tepidibacillus fermentans]|uniref:Uncharacterized protein DUF2276 n=1 Tax=Tepidibacillus fermentans TaxID=1281767 RepID=A0A4R3K7I7_9BACI|nr:CRISPR system precrRNA processing endoribonuclease RAMP protein Cas6 [Tepidibacillus fermentans]TCS78926.1 uncharacterized protein DUF2276 [Tepidibacillus fermentans]
MIDQELLDIVGKLQIARFEVIYEVGSYGVNLPPYKGSTIRGAFGHIFKMVACTCGSEDHLDNCIYQYIFETKPPENSEVLKKYESIPRPFVIEPILDPRTYFAPGEKLHFAFILFGKALDYLPYFIFTFQEMGKQGLGKNHHSLNLRQVFQTNLHHDLNTLIYDGEAGRIYNRWEPIYANEIFQSVENQYINNRLWVHFLTPTRLQKGGKYLSTAPQFEDVMKATMRRLTSILYFHQDLQFEMDFKKFFLHASKVELIKDQIEWVDWERYSNRQQERIKLGGILGKALYRGEIEPYLPWLKLAEWIHIGKNPVFGLGKIKVASH